MPEQRRLQVAHEQERYRLDARRGIDMAFSTFNAASRIRSIRWFFRFSAFTHPLNR